MIAVWNGKMGMAKRSNHPNVEQGEVFTLTKEEIEYNVSQGWIEQTSEVHMKANYIIPEDDVIMGDICTIHDVNIGIGVEW